MKAAGEVPPRITDFARNLAHRMDKAAAVDRAVRPIKAASIKNKLREWAFGRWPPFNNRDAHLDAHLCASHLR